MTTALPIIEQIFSVKSAMVGLIGTCHCWPEEKLIVWPKSYCTPGRRSASTSFCLGAFLEEGDDDGGGVLYLAAVGDRDFRLGEMKAARRDFRGAAFLGVLVGDRPPPPPLLERA